MNVSIICPLYNAEKYIVKLDKSIKMQEKVDIKSINYILTESSDNTENLLKELKVNYEVISREHFSHSKVRENAAFKSEGDILVFITQDVIINDAFWLFKLISPIINGEVEAAFSRQICDNNSIEKYIREKNYPKVSRTVSIKDVDELGLITFFFSDVSAAIRRDIYYELKGYDEKDLITNEDMYIAYKIINNGYKIKYCSDSEVIHSHVFTFGQLFRRYFDTGVFLKQNSYFLRYGANKSGMELFKYVFKRAKEEANYSVIINLIPNFIARFLGSTLGKRYEKLPVSWIKSFSSSKSYWVNNNY